jgi:hypothetical protein
MNIFKTTSEAENAINKLLPILLKGKKNIHSVEVNLTPSDSENEYYANLQFVFKGKSFSQDESDAILSLRSSLNSDIRKYLGIKLTINQTGVSTEK